MAAATVNTGIHFAPADPTLPPPWKALVDGSTGYIYYWNTETNVTQYEKPPPPQAPPQSVPPLPVGPPPGTTFQSQMQPVPAEPQSVAIVEMSNGNFTDSGGANVQSNVNSLNQGQGLHGMSNGSAQPAGMVNSQSVNPGSMISANMYGNFSNNPPGHSGGGHMSNGSLMGSNTGPGHIQGNASRTPGMSGASMHRISGDGTYPGSGRAGSGHSSGSSIPQGGTVGSMHPATNRSMQSGTMPMQPKVAVLPVPQRQQVVPGMHMPVQSRHMGHHANSGGPMCSGPGPFKRAANDFESEPMKRPRMQGFSEPGPLLDVDSYKRQHEITVLGDNVPPPFMTFESANFPPELAREVRYLLQPGAYVVRCAAATAKLQHTAVMLWRLHPCGLFARDIVPFRDYSVA